MDNDSDSDWDPSSDAEDQFEDDGFVDDHDHTTSAPGLSGPRPLLVPDTERAAFRVFALPELFEKILLEVIADTMASLRNSKERHTTRLEPLETICKLRRVNSTFYTGIAGSRKLNKMARSWEHDGDGKGEQDTGARGQLLQTCVLIHNFLTSDNVRQDTRAGLPIFWLVQRLDWGQCPRDVRR